MTPLSYVSHQPSATAAGATTPEPGRTSPERRHAPHPPAAPLSPAQRRLWFANHSTGGDDSYLVPLALRLRGTLDVEAMRTAVTDIVNRHAVLRTTFPNQAGTPVQVIQPAGFVDLPVRWVDSEAELLAEVTAAADQPIDLTVETPLRATLFRLSADDHVLLLMVHHIAIDGASLLVLMRDIGTAYTARRQAKKPAWPPTVLEYADYVAGHHACDATHDDDNETGHLHYWLRQLANLPAEIQLPADRPRAGTARPRAAQHQFSIGPDLHRRLTSLARANRVTLFMVLHAGFAALLTRLGAGTDVVIGAPVSGRTDETLAEMVGFFVDTVVLRTDVSGDPTFTELLTRVKATDLAAYAHQDLSFERLVEALRPPRVLGRHPLFQVMLTLQDGPPPLPTLTGLSTTQLAVAPTSTEFDLMLEFTPTRSGIGGAELAGVLTYRTDLFDPATAKQLTDRLLRIMEQVTDDPTVHVTGLDILVPLERRQLLHEWNATAVPVPATTLPVLFAQQVARTPDAVAVVDEHHQFTYRELDADVERLARFLVAQGAGPGRIIAVLLPRSTALVVALHAVHRAGAAYLPIDPDQPHERIHMMLVDAEPLLVLTEKTMAGASREPTVPGATLPHVAPEDPAYVIYTSGSTGRPKGVVVAHASIANRLLWMQATYGLTPSDRVLQKTPVGFDVSVWEFFWPLLAGATLVVARPDGHRDPVYLAEVIRHERVTVVHFVPSMLSTFLDYPGSVDLPYLRDVICSGEALPTSLARRWAAHSDARLHNLYGPTEATIDVTAHRFSPEDTGSTVPIGRPVWNTRVYVLDRTRRPVPVGVAGELYLAGVQLASGYLNQPELTAERFVELPDLASGERAYCTGDVVRWRPGGTLEYLGRIDDQVKIRGMRVEPGEIDARLAAHPDVSRAVTVVREDRPGDQRLVSYVVHRGDIGPGEDQLRRHLASVLPAHMVPAAIVVVAEIPVTANGKIDHRGLPVPTPSSRTDGRPPRTPLEHHLCQIFAEVLGLPRVSVDDSFFELGGHSLLAAQLINRLNREAGINLRIHALFETPSVAGILSLDPGTNDHDPLAVLFPLRLHGGRPPLFCIHPAAGVATVYAAFMPYLDRDQPVYGLQSPGIGLAAELPDEFDVLIDKYVEHIRQVRPEGPYRLLGWSFGALAAHAVATRLQAGGHEVDLLIMLDGYPPEPTTREDDLVGGEQAITSELIRSVGGDATAESAVPEATVLANLMIGDGERPGAPISVEDLARTFRNNLRLTAQFRPRTFVGDLLFFVARNDKDTDSPGPDAWRRHVTGRTKAIEIDCVHGDMMRPRPMSAIGPVVARALIHGTAALMAGPDPATARKD
ncbi:amino acid adenylation domain-containing protein [Micromonospora sp. NPDC049051]|uniref:amino acid adenylation domain-containing protein n=1 Tax=Micromonospora sp. NPDC049051 TaxID=3364264 RepID=UPI0037158F44